MIELAALSTNSVGIPHLRLPALVPLMPAPASLRPVGVKPVPLRAPPHWRDSLGLVEQYLPFTRRLVHEDAMVQLAGEPFTSLHIIKVGVVKSVALSASGREQVVGLHLPGEWIGFDCIASGVQGCDAFAMDTCEVWSLRYDAVLRAAVTVPAILHALCMAMSAQMARDREWRFSICTLSADARVADFVLNWVQALSARDLRTDQITLRLTRAEIGSYLGMTLETVSRSFSSLDRCGLIRFDDKGRRYFAVPSVPALTDYVRNMVDPPERKTLQ